MQLSQVRSYIVVDMARTRGYQAALDELLDTERVDLVDGSVAIIEARRYDGGTTRIAWARAAPSKRGGVIVDRARMRCLPADLTAIARGLERLAARLGAN